MDSKCIVIYRNTANGAVGFIEDENQQVMVFDSFEEARNCDAPILRVYPYQIVELDV